MPTSFKLFLTAMLVIAFGAYADHTNMSISINWGAIGVIIMFLMIMMGFHIVLLALNTVTKNQHKIMERLNKMDDK